MKISVQIENRIFIIKPEGLFADEDCINLKQVLEQSSKSFCQRVVIDLKHLNNITATGQRILLAYLNHLHALQTHLILCDVNQAVQDNFRTSGLDKVITILPTLSEAKTRSFSTK